MERHRQCRNHVRCHRRHDSFADCGLQVQVLLADSRMAFPVIADASVPLFIHLLDSRFEKIQFTSGLHQPGNYHVEFRSHR